MSSPRVVRARSKSVTHVSSKYEEDDLNSEYREDALIYRAELEKRTQQWHSLDYDEWTNELLIKEEETLGFHHIIGTNIIRWFLYFLVGLFTGSIAAFMDASINYITAIQNGFLVNYLAECKDNICFSIWCILWCLRYLVPVFIATIGTVYIAPHSAGSGIPIVIAYLNGVSIPKVGSLKLLIVKVFGVILVSVSGLALGKEGPLIHIGATVATVVTSAIKRIRIPQLHSRIFLLQTVQEKRDLMTAGCAAGFSATFGSPVAGTLLSLEEGTSFWNVYLMWRVFFCAIISSFTFTATSTFLNYKEQGKNSVFYFGSFKESTIDYKCMELPIFMLFGVIGGLLGAFFVSATSKIAEFRKRHENSRIIQVLDSLAVALLTALTALVLVILFSTSCREISSVSTHEKYSLIEGNCGLGMFNEMAFYWLEPQEATIRQMIHGKPGSISIWTLMTFFVVFFALFIITTGMKVPVGVFIPSLLIGSMWGRLLGEVIERIFPHLSVTSVITKYAMIGAAAQLGGVTRITISLTVVVLEATGTVTFGLPLMITFFITKWVGDFFNEGIYETQIHAQGIPLLPSDPPALTSDITAKDLMNPDVIAFPTVVTVSDVVDVLKMCIHQGFPVVQKPINEEISGFQTDTFGELRGFILRSQLITLLLTKSFTGPRSQKDVHHLLKLFRKYELDPIRVEDIYLSPEDMKCTINLKPYMNPSPYSVPVVMSLPRIFRLLRSLGLRHVIVVDNKNQVLGIITRKDLAKFRLWRHATTMGLKELTVQ